MSDHDELTGVLETIEDLTESQFIDFIESGIDLIEKAEGRRSHHVDRKEKSNHSKGFFSTGKKL